MLGALRNWGKWSDVDDVSLSGITLGDIAFENTLSIRVLELPLTFVGWNIWKYISVKRENQEIHLMICLDHNLEGLCWSHQEEKESFLWIVYQEDH